MKKIVFVLIFLLFSSLLTAGSLPEYPCYQLRETPVIDGKIEEKAWSDIPIATGFFILFGGDYALERQSCFKAGWDKKAIYIAVKCEEPEPEKIQANVVKNGDRNIFRDDSVEIFLFPDKKDDYFHFVINTIGCYWNGMGLGAPAQPLWNLQAKTYVGKDFWSLEVKIPFKVLKTVPKNEEKWLVNIARNTFTASYEKKYTCWPPLKKGFHDLKNFGSFIFKEKILSLKETIEIEKHLNWPKERIKEIANLYPQYKEIIEKSQGLKYQLAKVNLIKKDWDLINEVAKEETIKDRKKIFLAYQKIKDILKRTEGLKMMFEMEKLLEEKK